MSISSIQTPFNDILIDIAKRRTEKVIPILESIIKESIKTTEPNILNYVFAKALLQRLGKKDTSLESSRFLKKYSKETEATMIPKVLAKFPLVYAINSVSNKAFIEQCKKLNHFTMLDIGMTNFPKIGLILKEIKQQKIDLEYIKIVSFLCAAPDNIAVIEANLQKEIPHIPLSIICLDKHVSELSEKDWHQLQTTYQSNILIHNVFSSHYREGNYKKIYNQEYILKELKNFNPKLLILTDFSVGYKHKRFIRRFFSAWSHIKGLFEYIEALELDMDTKILLQLYFGHVLAQILEKMEYLGSEHTTRYKETSNWAELLNILGFKPSPFQENITTNDKLINASLEKNYISFKYENNVLAGMVIVES